MASMSVGVAMRTSIGGEVRWARDLGAEDAGPAEPEVAQRSAQRIEIDMVDREARRAVVEKHGSQLGEQPHHDLGRVGAVESAARPWAGTKPTPSTVCPHITHTGCPPSTAMNPSNIERLTAASVGILLPGDQCGDFVDVVAVEWLNHHRIIPTTPCRLADHRHAAGHCERSGSTLVTPTVAGPGIQPRVQRLPCHA